jgi:hypothetical protein
MLKSAPVECVVHFGAPLAFSVASDRKAVALETERRVRELAEAQLAS